MSTTIWRTRPVFITSTFRDMHAERDHLHNFVFPALKERLCERYHHLEPIDLRWGVETVGVDGQHAKEMLVLKVCLNEIERSRPFLIALLGDRYGWIPPKERITSAAQEAGYLHDLTGRSVTALEIEYGVLNSEDQLKRSFFYFREPLPCQDMDPATAAVYSDQYSPDPEGKKGYQRLIELKVRIEREHPERVRHYTSTWNREKNCVTGLEEWGRQVLEDLWGELDAETAEIAQHATTTWEEQERRSRDAFLESRSRDFTGRKELLKTLTNLATSERIINSDWGASITGPAGSGKSSLIARLAHDLDRDDHLMLTACAGTTPESGRVELLLRRWVDELTTSLGINSPLTEKTTAEELEQIFHQMLGRAAAKQRVIILIDALNQFENSPLARHLTWLPKRLPTNSRIIATAIPGDASVAFEGKSGVSAITLPPLNHSEADRIISTVCSRYHRELNPQIKKILLEKKDGTDNPAFGNPLWLTMALEELNLLDADDFARAEKQYSGTSEEKLLSLLIDTAEQLPGDVDDLYGWLLTRAEEAYGRPLVQAFVNTIAISRSGWREFDLIALMSNNSGRTWYDHAFSFSALQNMEIWFGGSRVFLWGPLEFAALRRGFRAHISQRGRHCQWNFSHPQMRIAVLKRNLADKAASKQLHATIADHLLTLPTDDPMHESETMVHLFGADDKQRAAIYYGSSELTDGEEQGATQALAELLTSGEQEEDGPEVRWMCEMLDAAKCDEEQIFKICKRIAVNLDDVLEDQARLRMRLALLEHAAVFAERLSDATKNLQMIWMNNIICGRIGDISFLTADMAKCCASYLRGLDFAEKLADLEPENNNLHNLSVSFGHMGKLACHLHDPDAARQWYLKSLNIAKRLADMEPDNNQYQRNLLVSYLNMGRLDEQSDLGAARQYYLNGLEIIEKLTTVEPANLRYLCDLSGALFSIGCLDNRIDPDESRQWFLKGLSVAERLKTIEPDNTEYLRNLSLFLIRMGKLDGQNNLQMARQWHLKALDIALKLNSLDPDNNRYLYDLSAFLIMIADLDGQSAPDTARHSYQKGLQILETLLTFEPENINYLKDLSILFSKLGTLDGQNNLELARGWYQKGLDLMERLLVIEPNNTEYLHKLSMFSNKIGNLVRLRDPDSAWRWYLKEIETIEKLTSMQPHNKELLRDLSILYNKMGDIDTQNAPEAAWQWYLKGLKIMEGLLVSESDNSDYLKFLFFSYYKMQNLDVQCHFEAVQQLYSRSIEIAEKLAAIETDNTDHQYSLSVSYCRAGHFVTQFDPKTARQYYLKGLSIAEILINLKPDNTDYQHALSVLFYNLADLDSWHAPETAQQWFLKGLKISELLTNLEPDNTRFLKDLSVIYHKRGEWDAQSDLEAAQQWYRKEIEICEKLSAIVDNTHY